MGVPQGVGSAPGGRRALLTTPLFAQTTRMGTTSSRRWPTGECPVPAAPLPCPMSPQVSPLGRGGDPGHLPVTGAGESPGGGVGGFHVPRCLTSTFVLFFPPLPSPERRVRPKCMAQRYCPLGSRLQGHPCAAGASPPCSPGRSAQPGTRGHPGRGVLLSPCHFVPLCLPASPIW